VARKRGIPYWMFEVGEGELVDRQNVAAAICPNSLTSGPYIPETNDNSLLNAARAGNLEKVRKLVENLGFPVDLTGSTGSTPMGGAARGGKNHPFEDADYLGVVKYLYEQGAVDSINYSLYLAVAFKRIEIVRYLTSVGAIIPEELGTRAVFYTARAGSEMLEEIAKIVDVNVRDGEGEVALHLLVKGGDLEAVGALVNLGASTKLADRSGKFPIQYADDLTDEIDRAIFKLLSPCI